MFHKRIYLISFCPSHPFECVGGCHLRCCRRIKQKNDLITKKLRQSKSIKIQLSAFLDSIITDTLK